MALPSAMSEGPCLHRGRELKAVQETRAWVGEKDTQRFKTRLYHLPATQLWVRHLIFLGLVVKFS